MILVLLNYLHQKKKSGDPMDLLSLNSFKVDNPHRRAILNSRILIYKKMGVIVTEDLIHSIKPLNKKVLFEVESEFERTFNHTLNNQFRDNSDTWIMSLHAFYSIAKKINYPFYLGPIRRNLLRYKLPFIRKNRDYVFIPLDLPDNKIISKFDAVINYKPLTFCVNDSPGAKASAKRITTENLKKMFPEKSIYEK